MNWKSIAIHALLLLVAGIVYGILEPQPSLASPKAFVVTYLLGQCALNLVYAIIFAHIAFKAENYAFAHTLLALLLSHEAASVLLASFLSYAQVESPAQPLPMLAYEYAMLIAAVAAGTSFGVRARRRYLSRANAVTSGAADV